MEVNFYKPVQKKFPLLLLVIILLVVPASCRHRQPGTENTVIADTSEITARAPQPLSNADSVRKVLAEKRHFEQALTDSLLKLGDETMNTPAGATEYFIIAGSYSGRSNASDLAEKYKKSGYQAEILPFKDKKDRQLFLVSVKTFRIRTDAESFLRVFRESNNKGAWILEKE